MIDANLIITNANDLIATTVGVGADYTGVNDVSLDSAFVGVLTSSTQAVVDALTQAGADFSGINPSNSAFILQQDLSSFSAIQIANAVKTAPIKSKDHYDVIILFNLNNVYSSPDNRS